jgi:hypothetical protein
MVLLEEGSRVAIFDPEIGYGGPKWALADRAAASTVLVVAPDVTREGGKLS